MLTEGLLCPSFEKLRTITGITSIPEHFSTKVGSVGEQDCVCTVSYVVLSMLQ